MESHRALDELIATSGDGTAAEAAVDAAASRRLGAFANGLQRYWAATFVRPERERRVVWRRGNAFLSTADALVPGSPPALLIPSLINRSTVMDLLPGCSFFDALRQAGYQPFLLEWGAPIADTVATDLDGYFNTFLVPAFAAMQGVNPRPAALIGYCMGGLLATALAFHRQGKGASALIALATPWDFHKPSADLGKKLAKTLRLWQPIIDAMGGLPVDALQALFATLDPTLVPRKFARFSAMDPESDAVSRFIAVEDWVNDGIPLTPAVCRQLGDGWFGANAPARGLWRCGNERIQPTGLALPSLVVAPEGDRIVPSASAEALAAALPQATLLKPGIGHVGMMVSESAKERVWRPLINWLDSRFASL